MYEGIIFGCCGILPGSDTIDTMAMYKCKIYGFQSFVRKLFFNSVYYKNGA